MSCAICFERFKGSDNLYSTTCGHIYHFGCMQQWKSRSSSCPQCRVYNPKTHKIYLELDDNETHDLSALQSELHASRAKINLLETELKTMKTKYTEYSQCHELQELQETLKDTLTYNANLAEQLKNNEIRISNYQNQINDLNRKIVSQNQLIAELTADKAILDQDYKKLQEKYDQKCAQSLFSIVLADMVRDAGIIIMGTNQHHSGNMCNFVLNIFRKMDLHYCRTDIIRATVLQNNSIMVQFRCQQMKSDVYRNEYKLSSYQETRDISIHCISYDDLNTFSLFDVALNLKLFGFKSVFRKGNKVFARKNDYEDADRIYCTEQVEELIREYEDDI